MIHIIFLLFIALSSFTVAAAPSQSYIIGSYVNVRVQPSKDADVIGHLTSNTPVTMLSLSGDWCEITWNADSHGFVACNLLGETPIKIKDVGEKFLLDSADQPLRENTGYPKSNPGYSPLRAFWIEPTVERLFDAGEHFRMMMFPSFRSQDDEFKSNAEHSITRFPLPEFEAMKSLLSKGIVSPPSQYVPPTNWKTIKDVEFYKQIKLPIAKPSFFKRLADVGSAGANTEAISAQFKIPFQITVLNNPYWGGDNNSYPLLVGAWDIGEIETRLTKPVYKIAVNLDGNLSIEESVVPSRNSRGNSQMYCIDSLKTGTALAIFYVSDQPALSRANIIAVQIADSYSNQDGNDPLEGFISTIQVDLDNDGSPDLVVWDNGVENADYPGNAPRVRVVFGNVAGEWYLLDTDVAQACGC